MPSWAVYQKGKVIYLVFIDGLELKPMYEYLATVNRVIDGDTIEVSVDLGFSLVWTTPVRLYGINAAETNSGVAAERSAAMAAKNFLTSSVMGKEVRVKTVKPKDKYGRYLAEVWKIDGLQPKSVNQTMVDMKLAKQWDGQGEKPV